MRAADVMTRCVAAVGPDDTVETIARTMLDHGVSAVPVVDHGRLIGVVSQSDLPRGLATGTDQPAPRPSDSDRGIQEQILQVIHDQLGAGTGSVAVIVVGGVAYLWGVAETLADKDAIRAAAERIVGADRVHDFLNTLPDVLRAAL